MIILNGGAKVVCGARGRRAAARGSAQAPHKLRGQQAYARTRMNGLSNVKARSTAVRGAAPQQVQQERTEGGGTARRRRVELWLPR